MTSNASVISKEKLLNAHERNGINNSTEYITNLVDALGGIKNVLTMILSSQDIQLNNEQLIKLNEIINSKTVISQTNVTNIRNAEDFHNGEPEEWTYYFDRSNTYLQALFGYTKAQNIFHHLYSSKCTLIVFLVLVLSVISHYILPSLNMFILKILYKKLNSLFFLFHI